MLYDNGWELLPNIITREEATNIKLSVINDAIQKTGDFKPKFDPQRGRVLMYYCPFYCLFVAKRIHKLLEEKLGEELLPTYWFVTSYFDKSYMLKHTDRPSCEISVSMNIYDSNIKSALELKDLHGNDQKIYTDRGSGVIYLGLEVEHWRSEMRLEEKEAFIQGFFHYVRKNGKYSNFAYDKDKNDIPKIMWDL